MPRLALVAVLTRLIDEKLKSFSPLEQVVAYGVPLEQPPSGQIVWLPADSAIGVVSVYVQVPPLSQLPDLVPASTVVMLSMNTCSLSWRSIGETSCTAVTVALADRLKCVGLAFICARETGSHGT